MPETPATWTADALRRRLEGTRFGDVRLFEQIDSTNRYLLDEARATADEGAEGVVAVADHQTAGRGRLGRTWTAPPGGSLLVSVLLRPGLPPTRMHLVTMVAGIGACEAVWLVAEFMPSLKWPNDLVVGRRKLAGLLSEAVLTEGRLDALVVGMGLNVNWVEFPTELSATATACNLVTGAQVDRAELLVAYLRRLDAGLERLAGPHGDRATLDEYRQRCATIGRRVRVEMAERAVEGMAAEVRDDGLLVVERDGGGTTEVAAGDVVHLRPA